ncbi:MAG: ATP-binding protein [Candidatus Aenigmatarchaeota archaeon]
MITQDFIDRDEELDFLESQNEERPSLAILYGRRRVGKTTLVERFCRDKKHVYYTAPESNKKEQLEEVYQVVYEELEDELIKDLKHDWETLLRYLKDKDLIIVLDEFPYIIRADDSIPSKIQRLWDKELKESNLFLILTGSSISMMEDEVLSPKSPLYGRRTGQWKLEPFSFKNAKDFFPEYSFEDKVKAYSILGGIPYFLEQFDVKVSIKENIRENILNKGSVLHNEVEFLMREEFRDPMNYYTILKSISRGNTKFSEIQNDTGIDKNNLSSYLSVLRNLHLVKRRTPITKKESKKGRYYLEDKFFRFWFNFIFPNKSQLETKDEILLDRIMKDLDRFVSFVFEDICREMLTYEYGEYEVGRWWYKEDEIDIVALNERENKILLGECKWSKNEVDFGLLNDLKKKTKKVRWNDEEREEEYTLFSRSGFSDELEEYADDSEELRLYSLKDMKVLFTS